ncbi:MAG: hypothetical protein QXP36_13315 [Conexivisphaerales archaeon]
MEYVVMRIFDGKVPDGLVLRTDNGPQYISQQFRKAIKFHESNWNTSENA